MPNLLTRWGRDFDRHNPLPEYPRPQFMRDGWINLNGIWDYAIYKQDKPLAGWQPGKCQGEITVPYSPEAQLSGVGHRLLPDETLCYRREFLLEELTPVTLLHFGAVDHACTAWVNQKEAGSHIGGFTPFSFDISALVQQGQNEIYIEVTDPSDTSYISRGKQSSKPGGIWYSSQSGIWQTVWLEQLPQRYLASVRMEPDIDRATINVTPSDDCVAILQDERHALKAGVINKIPVKDMRLWSPENPHLYDIHFECGDDRIQSYFGMRKFSLGKDAQGISRLFLNNEPYFHNGLLDQGYWPDGLLTPPSDEALLHDIREMKRLGFNMLRKHIKIELLRWYYHCDREGMLVWQDMVNGGRGGQRLGINGALPFIGARVKDGPRNYRRFGRENADGRAQYYAELDCMVSCLQNCVSLAMWVPFNEGWGQFDANKATHFILERDKSRLIDEASGWHDQGGGDCLSSHIYFRPLKAAKRKRGDERAFVMSEFGGYSYAIKHHVWKEGKVFGYKKFDSPQALQAAFATLYEKQLLPLIPQGLSAAVYTQVSDIEDEVNGLLTYDREICKVEPMEGIKLE